MKNDTYTFTEKEAVKLATFLVQMGKVEKDILIAKAKDGKVPSGFENQNGNVRVSWLENKSFANAVLGSVKESDKETKETVKPPIEPKPVEEKSSFFNKGKKDKNN